MTKRTINWKQSILLSQPENDIMLPDMPRKENQEKIQRKQKLMVTNVTGANVRDLNL